MHYLLTVDICFLLYLQLQTKFLETSSRRIIDGSYRFPLACITTPPGESIRAGTK